MPQAARDPIPLFQLGVLPTVKIPPSTKVPRVALTLGQCRLLSAEPHVPHVLMEKGDMTLGEFDQHLKGRADFIKGMKKDSSAERKVRAAEQRQRWQNRGGAGPRACAGPVRSLGPRVGWGDSPRSHSELTTPPPARPPAPGAIQVPESMKVEVAQASPTLCDPLDCTSMGFSRPEYGSG